MLHFYLRTTPSDKVRIIISVSKKVSKKAVDRNKIRRRVRPIAKDLAKSLKPANYFIVAKLGALEVKGQALEKELKSLMIV
jgi:ribonuclease P protein component